VQRYRKQLFPAAPMVFTGVEQRRIQWSSLTANDIVATFTHDFPAQFKNILQVLPDTKTIAVVNGASPNEKFWLGELQRETKIFQERVGFLWYEDASFEEILQRAAALPPNSAIFWHLMNVDAAGVSHEGGNALARLFASANAPIFSFYDTLFRGEIVGGPMLSIAEDSRKTAEVAIRILDGERPEDIKLEPQRYGAPKYDWRLLQRWGISEGNLPSGSEVLFRVPPLWQVYFWQIALVSAIVFGQAGLITCLLYERKRRISAEMEARQRMSELAHVNRYSIAGELSTSLAHELNQPLAAAANYLSAAKRLPSIDGSRVMALVDKAGQQILRAGEIIQRLRDFMAKGQLTRHATDIGPVLKEAVTLALTDRKHRSIKVVEHVNPNARLVLVDRVQIQQVLVNLIRNAAEAMEESPRRVITLATAAQEPGLIEVSVADTGPGMAENLADRLFQPFVTTKPDGMGVGLSICRTIVEAHGGTIEAEAKPHGGTVFRFTLKACRQR
jgi:signal transduction histidine kinase